MKQLFLLLMVLVTLIGCSLNPDFNDRRQASGEWWREDFDGHTYVVRGGSGHGYGSGISHDPDCKCNNPEYKSERNHGYFTSPQSQ